MSKKTLNKKKESQFEQHLKESFTRIRSNLKEVCCILVFVASSLAFLSTNPVLVNKNDGT